MHCIFVCSPVLSCPVLSSSVSSFVSPSVSSSVSSPVSSLVSSPPLYYLLNIVHYTSILLLLLSLHLLLHLSFFVLEFPPPPILTNENFFVASLIKRVECEHTLTSMANWGSGMLSFDSMSCTMSVRTADMMIGH